MRFLKWVSLMWVICFVPVAWLAHGLVGFKPGPGQEFGALVLALLVGVAYLGLVAAVPAIAIGWAGYACWRLTAPRKRRVDVEEIRPAAPPPAAPGPRSAGHRWLS